VAARIVTLIAALVVAAIGAALVIAYALEADRRAEARFDVVRVVVANDFIPAGTTLRRAAQPASGETVLITTVGVPRSALVEGSWISEVPGGAALDQVFISDVFPGDRITDDKLGPATGNVDLLGLNPDPAAAEGTEEAQGRAALVLALPDNQRGSAWLTAGSTVAVLMDERTPPEGIPPRTCVLVPDARVIAVGDETEPGIGAPATEDPSAAAEAQVSEVPPGFVVVEVDQTRALELTRAQDGGALYFVLLADTNAPTFTPGCYTDDQLNSRLGLPVG
jgi:pilus assembly protein CpaB